MGALTRAKIVLEGLQLSGNTSLTTLANGWLNDWLRSTAMSWPWPSLQRRAPSVPLAQGALDVSLGGGANGIIPEIRDIISPIWMYTSDYSYKGKIPIRNSTDGDLVEDETVNNPATYIGPPERFKLRADPITEGKFNLFPTPFPDRDYLLAIDFFVIPLSIDDSVLGDALKPWYRNDRTMVQAVKCYSLDHQSKGEEYMAELQVLENMVVTDRMKFGEITGTNDHMGLNSAVFR